MTAAITIAGIELMHRIRKGQFGLGRLVSKADLRLQCGMPCSKLEVSTVQHGTLSGAGYLHQSHMDHFRQSDLPKNSIRSLSLLSEVSVLAVAFQKISKRDRHAPRSHINHMLPIKTADEVPAKVVHICIEDDRTLKAPLLFRAKNHTVANYGDISGSTI